MATKKITDLTNVTSVKDTDLLLVETSEGTRSINRSGLLGGATVHPYNLLDNSDFRNPVNQRGQTIYNTNGYAIDRWLIFSITEGGTPELNLSSGYVKLGDGTYIQQRFEKGLLDFEKYYTLCVGYADGEVNVQRGEFLSLENFDCINIMPETSKDIKYIALYEGVYTVDTIPTYIPKGYAVELAECLRYFERIGTNFSECIASTFMPSSTTFVLFQLNYARKRTTPTIMINDIAQYRILTKTLSRETGAIVPLTMNAHNIMLDRCNLYITCDAVTTTSYGILQRRDSSTAAYIDVSADL